jgi:cytochrome c
LIPDFARNAHGNLAEQNRTVGPQRGVNTAGAPAHQQAKVVATAGASTTAAGGPALSLAQSNNCTACHAADSKLVGPSWADIRRKHAGKTDYLAEKIRSGGAGVWGSIPMPPQSLSENDAKAIASWLAGGTP